MLTVVGLPETLFPLLYPLTHPHRNNAAFIKTILFVLAKALQPVNRRHEAGLATGTFSHLNITDLVSRSGKRSLITSASSNYAEMKAIQFATISNFQKSSYN